MPITTDKKDKRLGYGIDKEPCKQQEAYLVLSDEERSKGFIRPVRLSYKHKLCGSVTKMNQAIAETYAINPKFYGATYCCNCRKHLAVSEFVWDDGSEVGS